MTPVDVVTPTLHDILTEAGRSRLTVTMRYHGAVAALLHNRPAVLLDYSPKMASLPGEAGGWTSLLGLDQLEAKQLRVAVSDALAACDRAPDALAEARGRLDANDAALDELPAGLPRGGRQLRVAAGCRGHSWWHGRSASSPFSPPRAQA